MCDINGSGGVVVYPLSRSPVGVHLGHEINDHFLGRPLGKTLWLHALCVSQFVSVSFNI